MQRSRLTTMPAIYLLIERAGAGEHAVAPEPALTTGASHM
jgi:hypothetical protein